MTQFLNQISSLTSDDQRSFEEDLESALKGIRTTSKAERQALIYEMTVRIIEKSPNEASHNIRYSDKSRSRQVQYLLALVRRDRSLELLTGLKFALETLQENQPSYLALEIRSAIPEKIQLLNNIVASTPQAGSLQHWETMPPFFKGDLVFSGVFSLLYRWYMLLRLLYDVHPWISRGILSSGSH